MEEYNSIETLEASLDNSPGDVALWIKLAKLQLHQASDGDNVDTCLDNVSQALSTLSRGLEENANSEVCDFSTCTYSSFQMTVESNYVIAIPTLSDWLKRLAPVFQPMRSKTKTNRTMYA